MALSLKIEYTPVVNLAIQQSGIPVIRDVILSLPEGEQAVSDLVVTFFLRPRSSPSPLQMHVSSLEPGSSEKVSPTDVKMKVEYLSTLSERVEGRICVKVTSGEDVLAEDSQPPISVLAFNEWPGAGVHPALTASFVTPNHPSVQGIP